MAKVSLRIYNREIERLVEQAHIDEAIAHCHHILKTFPKHLETYRHLGKAYLEAKRYGEAVDIFGRVLMAVPGDFVAHVGLSIINDEENKLDDAIWHMERAFEAQPSNAAIQGELQRLYGRRDGMEPPKIRMTRGALAHMYVQGELYPQAIAEIRAVLAQDPQRSDMQSLLAYSYFMAGQKSDASDICDQLLKRYPYCYDANRIKVELLPATAGATESTQVYRMRLGELDPYSNFVKGSVFQTQEVSDASVNLERYEYTGEQVPAGQEWSSSLGIELGSSAAGAASTFDEQPDWLKSAGLTSETPPSAPMPDSAFEKKEEIPDFLRAAGWGESSTPEQPTSMFDEEPAGEPLVPADLPDWLKGQMPASEDRERPTEPQPSEMMGTTETPDWLSGLDGNEPTGSSESPQAESTATGDVPDWLSGLGRDQKENEPATVPDWISTPDSLQPAAEPANLPDWLSGAEPKSSATPSIENLGTSAQEQDDAVAWLESLAAKHGAKPEELVTDPNKRSETPPDWVSQAQSANQQLAAQQPNVQDLGATSQEQDDAVAWLESLAAKHGAKPEELVTDPNKRSETPPEWVQQAQSIGEAQSISSSETPAEKTEWVEGAQNIGEQFFAEFESGSKPAPAADETGMWLRDLAEKEPQEDQPLQRGEIPEWLSDSQQPSEKQSTSDLPDWLSGLDKETPAESGEYISQNLSNQDLSDWLSGLDDEPGLDIDPELIRAPSRPPLPDSFEKTMKPQPTQTDLPDWLGGLDSESKSDDNEWKQSVEQEPASFPTGEPVSAQESPVTLSADLPDWLKGVDEEAAESGQVDEDTPPWLHREQWEAETPQQLKPTSPSDWHPLEPKPATIQKQTPDAQSRPPVYMPPPSQTRAPSIMQNPPPPEPSEKTTVEKKKPAKRARPPKAEGQSNINVLGQAKGELDRGDIPAALDHYGKLIKKGKHLEETIRDLTESIYRYPVEVGIWQTLGDAYMRANRLKEALEAYNKAEELIR